MLPCPRMIELYRAAVLEENGVNVEARTVKLSFASEKLVLRDDGRGEYWERLSHGPGDANFGLLNTQGVLLAEHVPSLEIGEVVKGSARVEPDRKSRATVRIHPS